MLLNISFILYRPPLENYFQDLEFRAHLLTKAGSCKHLYVCKPQNMTGSFLAVDISGSTHIEVFTSEYPGLGPIHSEIDHLNIFGPV